MNKTIIRISDALGKKSNLNEVVISLLLYFTSPILGILAQLLFLITNRTFSKCQFYCCFFFLAAWLGCINATKFPVSDEAAYREFFNCVPDSTLHFIIFQNELVREYLYNIITYIGYYATLGYFPLFIFCITTFIYILNFISTYKLFSLSNLPRSYAIYGSLLLAFFIQYFSLTAHLIRQELALSLIIYAFARKAEDGRNHWIILLSAFFIHSASAFLIILSCIPQFKNYIPLRKFSFWILSIIVIVLFNETLGNYISSITGGISILDYTISRYKSNNTDLEEKVSYSIMLIIIIPMIFTTMYFIYIKKIKIIQLYPILYSFVCLSIFILISYKNQLTQYRFFYQSYSFIPIIFPLLSKIMGRYGTIYLFAITSFQAIRFFVLYQVQPFQYAPLTDILLYPMPILIFTPYYT